LTTTVEKIATALDEKDETPLAEIERVVKVLGDERALTILEQTVKIEVEGGMMTDDGTRRRTAGGVFFKLVKNETTPKERGKIFGARPGGSPKPITWEESEQLSNEALELPQGEITKVKITIMGRPGRVIEKDMVVITSMQAAKVPNLPKGLPKPPGDPTTYVVYMATKQWRKVKDSINENSDDMLIIDGYPLFDKRIGKTGAMTVYAQNVTSKLVQQARRDAQRAGAKKE
jgi:hypothetical protein